MGLYEALAGVPVARRQRVIHRLLRTEQDDLVDLLGEEPALPQRVLGALFRELSTPAPRTNSDVQLGRSGSKLTRTSTGERLLDAANTSCVARFSQRPRSAIVSGIVRDTG